MKTTRAKTIAKAFCLLAFSLFITGLRAGDFKTGATGDNNLAVKENTYQVLTVTNTLSTITTKTVKTSHGFFTEIDIPGYTHTAGYGSPDLPVMRRLIEIPVGAEAVMTITGTTSTEYSLSELGSLYAIIPAQLPVSKSGPAPDFVQNANAYRQNSFFPQQLASVEVLGFMRGIRLGRLNITPFQYNPVTGRVRVYDQIKIRIDFNGGDVAKTIEMKKMNSSPYFVTMDRDVINQKSLPAEKSVNFAKYPVKYVIVAPQMFESSLQPFIAWKKKKGFNVVEAYTSNPNVGTTTTSIKNYLQGLYNAGTPQDPAPSFVLLVGDVAEIPAFQGLSGSHVTDLYYADYTNDNIPDVFIGRFSAENESQLAPQINKTLEYEQYLMPDPSFLNQVVMIAGVDASNGPTYGNGQINYGTNYYFNSGNGLTSHTYLYPASGSSASQIIQDVSNGVGYANYTAHGSPDGWYSPAFSISDIAGLQNNHKYPLMVGNCCLTNKFDDPVCFGEALLRADGKGAIGYIGGSNSSYWDEDYWWGIGVRAVQPNPPYVASEPKGAYDLTFHTHGEPFNQWFMSQGQMVVAGNLSVTQSTSGSILYYWEIYHLMGDPSLMIYYSVPPPVTATYNNLMPLNTTSFTVNANPHTYVAISKGGVLYGAAITDSLGVCNLSLDPITSPGYATIVITGQNLQPRIDSIMIATPTGPYVMMNNYHVIDAAGNNNGQVDFGETISLDMTLKNWGQSICNNVTTTISTTDSYVNITDNTQGFGNIAVGATSTQNNAYTFTVANNVPDQHTVLFNVLIQDNAGNNWTAQIQVVVNAPAFSINNLVINDNVTGNGNGHLDPCENVQLIINATNSGHADAPLTMGNLSTASGFITLNTTTSPMNTINAGAAGTATFSATVSSSVANGTNIPLNFTMNSGNYSAQKMFYPVVGLVIENWESGTVTTFPWQFTGPQPWFISTNNPYEGSYSLQSGLITDNQQTDVSLTADVLMEDSISFYRKVSSEPDYDYLQFFIDANNVDQWSGEQAWAREAYLVSSGNHTFKWTYIKDQNTLAGSDAAWIDFVTLPPVSGMATGISSQDPLLTSLNIYPNPTSGNTTIVFYTEKSEKVNLKVLNSTGQEVRIILNEKLTGSGNHLFYFDASTLSKGIYFCRFNCGSYQTTKKLLVY